MTRSKRTPKTVPAFKTEAEERRFWETHDTTAYVDWSAAKPARFPNLKPSTETISLRLPAGLLADLTALANKQDVPCQSLLKVFLADRVTFARGSRGLCSRRLHSVSPDACSFRRPRQHTSPGILKQHLFSSLRHQPASKRGSTIGRRPEGRTARSRSIRSRPAHIGSPAVARSTYT